MGQSEGIPALHHIREEKQLLSPISSVVLVKVWSLGTSKVLEAQKVETWCATGRL